MNKKLLIVEDEASIRGLYARILELLDLEDQAVFANDGNDGLLLFGAHRNELALVITDNDMPPGIPGTEMVKAMRAQGFTGCILMVSGRMSEDEAMEAGADHFMTKPFDTMKFMALIKQQLGL